MLQASEITSGAEVAWPQTLKCVVKTFAGRAFVLPLLLFVIIFMA